MASPVCCCCWLLLLLLCASLAFSYCPPHTHTIFLCPQIIEEYPHGPPEFGELDKLLLIAREDMVRSLKRGPHRMDLGASSSSSGSSSNRSSSSSRVGGISAAEEELARYAAR